MESMGKTASPYLSVLEIQTAQVGQVGLSCLLQLPGKSLGLTSIRTERQGPATWWLDSETTAE